MATTNNVKTQDLLDLIHNKYEQATDTPSLTDDDGKIRLNLLNEGINRHETEDGIIWNELIVPEFTASAVTTSRKYDLSFDDFRKILSRVRFTRTDGSVFWAEYVTPSYYTQHRDGNGKVATQSGGLAITITGSVANGFQLVLGWQPTTSDGTIGAIPSFDYYKWANRMTTVTQIPEMSNPYFLVDWVTGELFANDDPNLYSKFNGDAMAKLANMRVDNEALPPYASTAIEDQNYSFAMG